MKYVIGYFQVMRWYTIFSFKALHILYNKIQCYFYNKDTLLNNNYQWNIYALTVSRVWDLHILKSPPHKMKYLYWIGHLKRVKMVNYVFFTIIKKKKQQESWYHTHTHTQRKRKRKSESSRCRAEMKMSLIVRLVNL